MKAFLDFLRWLAIALVVLFGLGLVSETLYMCYAYPEEVKSALGNP